MNALDRLIDASVSCTKCGTRGVGNCRCWDAPVDEQHRKMIEDVAQDIACGVVDHIDRMYPQMWKAVPKTARTSVRNTIFNRVVAALTPR